MDSKSKWLLFNLHFTPKFLYAHRLPGWDDAKGGPQDSHTIPRVSWDVPHPMEVTSGRFWTIHLEMRGVPRDPKEPLGTPQKV